MNGRHTADGNGAFLAAVAALSLLLLLPGPLAAAGPAWWTARGVLTPGAVANDYGVANQGQARNIALKAIAELNARLRDGAGPVLNQLAITLSATAANTNDYAPVNLGQLKNIAKPFYDRLYEVGYLGPPLAAGQKYPWDGKAAQANDFGVANIGQVKQLFSFDPASGQSTGYDGFADYWAPQPAPNPAATDPYGDLWTDAQKQLLGLSGSAVGSQPLWLEAEDAESIVGWTVASDPLASGGRYLSTTGFGTNENRDIMATWRFRVRETGDYIVMGRVIAPNQDADSLWIRVDAGPWVYRKLPGVSQWHWHTLNSYPSGNVLPFPLMAGVHTLTIRVRQYGTQLDKLVIMKNVPALAADFTPLNPSDALDADLDGMPDQWEIAHGLDPSNPQDADADPDSDGRSNRLEYAYGSDPQVADVSAPAAPTALAFTGTTDVAATLRWIEPGGFISLLSRQDLQYDIYRDGVKVAESLLPCYRDTGLNPSTAYAYTVVAKDRQGNTSPPSAAVNVTTLPAQMPAPWQHGEITAQDVRGNATYDSQTGKFALHAVSTDAYVNPDVEHWVYQPVTGNVRITALLESLSGTDVCSQAGLTVRSSQDGSAAMARIGVRESMGALWESRFAGAQKDTTLLPAQPVPVWLRLEVRGSEATAFYSSDGNQWQPIGSRWVDLGGGNLLVGLYASGQTAQPVDAVFSHVTIESISDQSNTTPPDSASFTTIDTIPGSAFAAVSGQWIAGADDSAVSLDRRGAVDYSFDTPSDGVWFLELDVSPLGNTADLHVEIPLQLYLDGQLLGNFTMQSFSGAIDTIRAQCPWIAAGNHALRVVNLNPYGDRTIEIHAVRLLQPEGQNSTGDGIPDWLTQMLASQNSVKALPAESFTSPLCVEGTARNADLGGVVVGNQTYPLLKQANGLWYADIPLSADAPTAIETSFENGAVTNSSVVTWQPLNVLEAADATLNIRKGDSLQLTAYPVGGAASGNVQFAIIGSTGTNAISTTADVPSVVTFDQPGTYTIQAAVQQDASSASGSMTVQVTAADFGAPLFAYLQNARNWTLLGVQPRSTLGWDDNLLVSESPQAAGVARTVQVYPIASGTYYAVARLSPDGPILARGEVDAYAAYSATTTGDTRVVATYDDGDRLVQSTIVVDNLPPGGYAEVRIIVAGVTFEDGTTVKRLYASDFVNGVATLTFNYPKDVGASVCHQVTLFDAQGNQVGSM